MAMHWLSRREKSKKAAVSEDQSISFDKHIGLNRLHEKMKVIWLGLKDI